MNKMRDLKSYFSDAQDNANDNFFSYDGGFNDDYVANGETFSNFGGDDDAFMMSAFVLVTKGIHFNCVIMTAHIYVASHIALGQISVSS